MIIISTIPIHTNIIGRKPFNFNRVFCAHPIHSFVEIHKNESKKNQFYNLIEYNDTKFNVLQ